VFFRGQAPAGKRPVKKPHNFSLEFFPPRSPEAQQTFDATLERLARLGPDWCSVTYGAGGSTRELTFETAQAIRDRGGVPGVPHVSCVGSTRADLRTVLERYRADGFRHIVALRGDLPSGSIGGGELRYASELVEFVRRETGDWFRIDVACYPEVHPQAAGAGADLRHFKRKVDAGADGAITQYFYNADAYFRFVESARALGIGVPIVAGVMPITNYTQLARFSEGCGAEIPRWVVKRLQDFGDDRESIRAFGIDVTTQLCRALLDGGAPGLHFYTMNQARATEAVWRNLGIAARAALRDAGSR
jgi:methylenetetrahydrofolate reductase (NADPH)